MRSNRNKSTINKPNSLENATAEQNRIAKEVDLDAISDSIYKGNKIVIVDNEDPYNGKEEYEVRYSLRKLYHNKCAYCEKTEYKPDVEHYRPKKRITKVVGNGYYWLCYEWTNLLPACSECNSKNGKWNQFPVLAQRVTAPTFLADGNLDFSDCLADSGYLQRERPFLLHPEVDIPENYFRLNWGNGELIGIDSEGRGNQTIEICDLQRGNLIVKRERIISDFTKHIMRIFEDFRNDDTSVDKLERKILENFVFLLEETNPEIEYSLVYVCIYRNFEDFVNICLTELDFAEKLLLLQLFEDIQGIIEI
jgi:uncharacterized protein (TIGR02646 family)